MPIKISGIFKDGMGQPIPNCTIELKSRKTSISVITQTEARTNLDFAGSYSMNVEPCHYDVLLYIKGYPPKRVGDIHVYSDSRPGTLNDFLMMPEESDITPETILIFQQLRDEAKEAAERATANALSVAQSASKAASSEAAAAESEKNANASMQAASADAVNAENSATAAAESKIHAEANAKLASESAIYASNSASEVIKSETGAAISAARALESENGAIASAITAANEADRAKAEADRATASTDGKQDKLNISNIGQLLISASDETAIREAVGAAADINVLKIENNLSEFQTALERQRALENLGIGNVITESNSVYRKSGKITTENDNEHWGWDFLSGGDGQGISWVGSSESMEYSSYGIQLNPAGGSFDDWMDRGTGVLISAPHSYSSAHSIFKAVQWGRAWLTGLDVYYPSNGFVHLVMHVGGVDFGWYGNGDASMSGTLTCNSVVQTSDKNKKHDIKDIENADDIVMSWTGKTFKLNNSDISSAGIIAQDIAEKFPVAVTELQDGSLGVDYSALHAPIIESLKNRIKNEAALLKRIEKLEARLDILSK